MQLLLATAINWNTFKIFQAFWERFLKVTMVSCVTITRVCHLTQWQSTQKSLLLLTAMNGSIKYYNICQLFTHVKLGSNIAVNNVLQVYVTTPDFLYFGVKVWKKVWFAAHDNKCLVAHMCIKLTRSILPWYTLCMIGKAHHCLPWRDHILIGIESTDSLWWNKTLDHISIHYRSGPIYSDAYDIHFTITNTKSQFL